jgi:hypothetical protein
MKIEIEKKIVKEFKNDITMTMWLSEKSNVENLKIQYSPEKYSAEISLINKQVLAVRTSPLLDAHKLKTRKCKTK